MRRLFTPDATPRIKTRQQTIFVAELCPDDDYEPRRSDSPLGFSSLSAVLAA
jgi:hypothetical protein